MQRKSQAGADIRPKTEVQEAGDYIYCYDRPGNSETEGETLDKDRKSVV